MSLNLQATSKIFLNKRDSTLCFTVAVLPINDIWSFLLRLELGPP